VFKSLLVSFELEVGVSKLSMGDDKKKDALIMNSDEDLALRKAVDASCENFFWIVRTLSLDLIPI
jgi:hypothetical protein